MADDFEWKAVFKFDSDGAPRVTNEAEGLTKALNRLAGSQEKANAQAANTSAYRKQRDAMRETETASLRLNQQLAAQRYALYDTATTYGAISAALLGFSTLAVTTGASYETAFTGVERTTDATGAQVEELRQQLLQMSTEIPASFQDISGVAQLGNQLGVASKDIEGFTQTAIQFSQVTGLTTEATAQAFGRIGNLLGLQDQEYNALGSSIALVGRRSEATEQQIITLVERLASTGSRAGLTESEVIGLSGALASLGVAPERAQGVFETYFDRLNTAVAEGGESLQNFSVITGLATSEIDKLVRSGQGMTVLRSFLEGFSSRNTVETTQALQALNLQGIRTGEVLPRLAGNLGLLDQSLADANQGFSENTELQRQYALVLDNVASQFQILVNSVNNFLAALSGGSLGGLSDFLAVLSSVVNVATEFIGTDLGGTIVRFGLVMSTTVGIILAFRAASALAAGSAYALAAAQSIASGASLGFKGNLGSLIALLLGVKVSALQAATGVGRLRLALVAFARATVVLGLLALASELVLNFGGSMQFVADGFRNFQGPITAVGTSVVRFGMVSLQAIAAVAKGLAQLSGSIPGLSKARLGFLSVADGAGKLSGALRGGLNAGLFDKAIDNAIDGFENWAYGMQDANRASDDLGAALNSLDTGVGDLGAEGMENLADAAGGAAGQVRTLVDYSNDLREVLNRALEIRNGPENALDAYNLALIEMEQRFADADKEVLKLQDSLSAAFGDSATAYAKTFTEEFSKSLGTGLQEAVSRAFSVQGSRDDITSRFYDLVDAIDDAKRALVSLQADLLDLNSQETIARTQLAVAVDYGDTTRAAALQAELAQIESKRAENLSKQAEEQAKFSTELDGSSRAAIQNRQRLLDLLNGYRSFISTLAEVGADQADVQNAVKDSRRDFLGQAKALGFTEDQLTSYIAVFDAFDASAVSTGTDAVSKANKALADSISNVRDLQAQLVKAQSEASRELTGNSAAAIRNRQAIADLQSKYIDYIAALAASGASQRDLERASINAQAQFRGQLSSMGFAKSETDRYNTSLGDTIRIIRAIPPRVTVGADPDPARQALNEYVARVNSTRGNVGIDSPGAYGAGLDAGRRFAQGIRDQTNQLEFNQLYTKPGQRPIGIGVFRLESRGYAEGGYTGAGGKYEPAGIVHKGEYVVPKKHVNQSTGLPHADVMGRLTQGKRGPGYAGGGFVGNSSSNMMVVELSAHDRMLLAKAGRGDIVFSGAGLQKATLSAAFSRSERGSD